MLKCGRKSRLLRLALAIVPALIITGFFALATSNPHTWTDGLVGYWSFDGQYTTTTSGTGAGTRDVSNNNNWGAFNSGVKPVAGIVGQALSFDGVDDYVDAGNGASLDITTGSVSIEAWIKTTFTGDWGRIAIKRTGATNWYSAAVRSGKLGMELASSYPTYYNDTSSNVTINDGIWHHVVAVRDASDSKIKLYVDGVLDNQATDNTAGRTLTDAGALTIGTWLGSISTNSLNGLIDEVRIYNRALSADEVKQHYDQTRRNIKVATSNPNDWSSGLAGYWNFDGQNTTSTNGTRDTSGNNNWGTFNGGVKPTAGIVGQALSFDGVDDYVNIADSSSLRLPTEFTLEAWIKVDTIFDEEWVISKYGNYIWRIMAAGELQLWYGDAAKTSWAYYSALAPAGTITTNVWTHIAVRIKVGEAGQVYKNAVDVTSSASTPTDIWTGAEVLRIGKNQWSSGTAGLIDEFRIYNRALSAGEIKQHYDQTRRNIKVATSNPHDWSSGLVGYWNFDGQNTTSTNGTRDTSGNNNWGTFSGGVKPTAGIVGQALSFDGVDDLVGISGVSKPATQLTFELWLKIPSIAEEEWSHVLGWGAPRLYQNPAPNADKVVLSYYVNATQYWPIIATVSYDVWNHIVVVMNSGEGKVYPYLNGQAQSTATTITGTITYTDLTGLYPFYVGGETQWSEYKQQSIDEVRIYNRALGADEVMQHYQQTKRNLKL